MMLFRQAFLKFLLALNFRDSNEQFPQILSWEQKQAELLTRGSLDVVTPPPSQLYPAWGGGAWGPFVLYREMSSS